MKKLSNSIKYGDVFTLGDHVIACGDSRDKELVAKAVGSRKIKAVICDPPFGVALAGDGTNFKKLSKNKAIANDHIQSDEEYRVFTRDWIEAVKLHLARKNVFYIFNSDKMLFALREGLLDAECKFAQLLIWVKTQAVIGRLDFSPQHELIVYAWHGTHEFLKSKDRSVLVYPKPSKSPLHPSTKPTGLVRRLVLNNTRIGDVVFDGFLGSGTTLLACEETKRICVGIELDPEYIETTIWQYERRKGRAAERIS